MAARSAEPYATLIRPADSAPGHPGPAYGLSPELLLKARRRLAALVTIFALVSIVSLAIGFAVLPNGIPRASLLVHLLNLGSAVVILALALSPRVAHTVALHAGLAGEVLSCWAISFVAIQGVYEETGAVPHLTWASIVIVVFPMIIPLPPGRLLIAAILSAASAPLSGLLLQATGRIVLTTEALVGISISPALAVGIAFAGARMIYAINVDISRARRMGAYRLEEKLGAGGMGEVWRASHRMLARPAAVKLIAPRQLAGNPDLARRTIHRFEQEVQATARLRSPHTVEVYDYGIADDGSFYYVMELLEGRNLQDLVARHGPLPAARVVPILRQACHSLGEAHQAGLVHRDIKPANMILCRYGA
ncbi:MAG: serine/threonine protein kinase, partial [Candidatus Eisenbacteria bacterium]|nr:serine/threonine protein kinase [Candidatus Eisenbacteria bacterium]